MLARFCGGCVGGNRDDVRNIRRFQKSHWTSLSHPRSAEIIAPVILVDD
jgi:hypothetical protein